MKNCYLDTNPFFLDGWKLDSSYAPIRHRSSLPPRAGLYSITMFNEINELHKVVYIGLSQNLLKRLRIHTHQIIRSLIKKYGFCDVWFKEFIGTEMELMDAETMLIHKYDPSFNIRQKLRAL
jgi:predicted GIY-YIG superfamily endonuclease